MKYLKLNSEAVSAYSNVKKPIYLTSGCPKNQKRCWNNIGSPPPAASKKDVLKFLSVKTIVIPIFLFIYWIKSHSYKASKVDSISHDIVWTISYAFNL
jgi:hypothetical protein